MHSSNFSRFGTRIPLLVSLSVLALVAGVQCSSDTKDVAAQKSSTDGGAAGQGDITQSDPVKASAVSQIEQGRQAFRFNTFGDEDFWGGTLKLHQAIQGSANGGVGDGVSPELALSVGLKIDVDALSGQLQDDGAKSFVKSWNELMGVIGSKSEALKRAS